MTLWMEIMGWTGAALVLGAYALLSMKIISSNSYLYHVINVIGAGMLAYYTYSKDAIPSALLNITWSFIGVAAMVGIYRAVSKKNA